jgi:tRNA (guanine37-N1)-methyltransferase
MKLDWNYIFFMQFDIITIFPSIFDSYFSESILKRAQKSGAIKINIHNLRDFATDKHHTTDDTPYGGGAGMVMKVEPIYRAIKSIKSIKSVKFKTRIILFSAKGKKYTQADAKRLSGYDQLVLICGRYEGVDERVAEHIVDEELSIGDYVLTGGEIPAMIAVDSVARLLPGVLGNVESSIYESHSAPRYLEHPQYTKPEKFLDWNVPEVLLGGNHKEIEKWRVKNSKKYSFR